MGAVRTPRLAPGAAKDNGDRRRSIINPEAAPDDPMWKMLYGELLKNSLCFFAKEILKIEIGPHHVEWGDLVAKHKRLAVIAARDHSKSTFFSYAYPIWRAWQHPGCEVYIFSATLEQAMDLLEIVIYGKKNLRGMIDVPELAHLVPSESDTRGKKKRLNRQDVVLTNGSRIRAVGYGKKIRGRHPDYIVCDDVLNDEDLFSEKVRAKHISYFKSAISNMITPDGQIVAIGTPFHAADLWGDLKHNPEYVFRRYPGIIRDRNGNERALFPWRYTLAQLRAKKREIGSVAFAREILCQPISDDLSIFPPSLFPPLYEKTLTIRPTREALRQRGWTTYMGVDIAISASVGADYFVIFVIGVDNEGQHHIVDIRREKGLTFKKQLEMIEHWGRYYDCSMIFIESNQAQRVWSDEMKRTTDVPVKEFTTLAQNKYPLDKGIPGLRILMENGKVRIPRGNALSRKLTQIWIDECVSFGFFEGKLQGAGAHDDTVMAWWFATEARKAGGFGFSMGAEEDDDQLERELMGEDESGESWEDVLIGGDDDDSEDDDRSLLLG